MSNVEVRIVEHSNPCNETHSEPVRPLRENPSRSFSLKILFTAQSFHKHRIIEGLMIQQYEPRLSKPVYSYLAKLFLSGIT